MTPSTFILCASKHLTVDTGSGKCAHAKCAAATVALFSVPVSLKR